MILILDRLPDPNLRFPSGSNSFYADPLAKPVALGDEKMVGPLVENGASVNVRPGSGGRGVPALSLAVINGQHGMVNLLLSLNAAVGTLPPFRGSVNPLQDCGTSGGSHDGLSTEHMPHVVVKPFMLCHRSIANRNRRR